MKKRLLFTKHRAILCVILCFAMVLPFAGCGKNQEETTFEAYDRPISAADVREEKGVYYAASQILLTSVSDASFKEIEKLVKSCGGEIIGYLSATGDYQLCFPDASTLEALETLVDKLKADPLVEDAMPAYAAQLSSDAIDYTLDPWLDTENPSDLSGSDWDNDSPAGNNWWAEAIDMPVVWDMDFSAQTVKVGVIDTMFDTDNDDLDEGLFAKTWNNPVNENGSCRVAQMYNDAVEAYNQAASSEDQDLIDRAIDDVSSASHGTHVAGIIAAQAENSFGIAGVCQNAKLYGYSLHSDEADSSSEGKWGSVFQFKCAIAHMLNEGVKVINISMGLNAALMGTQDGDSSWKTFTSVNSKALESFLLKYIDAGHEFLIMKSAGNDSSSDKKYDAGNDLFGAISNERVAQRIMIVGAAKYNTQNDYYHITDFSNTGSRVDVYAPGVDVLSDIPSDAASFMSGTSMATPIVTGLAALIWSINPSLSAQQVRSFIIASRSATMFDLDDEWAIIRDFIGWVNDPTPIVNARICVQLAQGTTGNGSTPNGEYGTITGMAYAVSSAGTEFVDLDIKKLSLYNANGDLISTVPVQTTICRASDRNYNLYTYTHLAEPGTYTLKLEVEEYEIQSQQVTVEANAVVQANFEYISLKNLVTDALSRDLTYTTLMYNNETDRSEETEVTCLFRLPKINLPGDDVKRINEEILNAHTSAIEDAAEEIAEYGYPLISDEILYFWSVNGDILSLVVRDSSFPDMSGGYVYNVYNVSISSGKQLADAAVWEAAGLSESEFIEKAKQVLGSSFWGNWDPSDEQFSSKSFTEFFNEQLRKTVSNANIDQSYPYINGQGQLCLIARKYSLAAADYYWHNLNMVDFELVPHYAQEAQRKTHAINISEEKAREMAYDYWNFREGDVEEETGYKLYLIFDGLAEDDKGNHFYVFRLRWMVPESNHLSTVDMLYINAETGKCAYNMREAASPDATDQSTPLLNWVNNCDTKRFTKNDLTSFDKEDCRLARNAIFAKSGRKFSDQALQSYFGQFDWYQPRVSSDDFSNSMLNDIQRHNLDLIMAYEESCGYR